MTTGAYPSKPGTQATTNKQNENLGKHTEPNSKTGTRPKPTQLEHNQQ